MNLSLGDVTHIGSNNGISYQLSDGSHTTSKAVAEFDGYSRLMLLNIEQMRRQLIELRASGEGIEQLESQIQRLSPLLECVRMYLSKVKALL